MKNILNKILPFMVMVIAYITLISNINALNFKKVEVLEIYQIKTTEEILISTNSLIEVYENKLINLEMVKEESEEVIEEIVEDVIVEEVRDLTLANEIVNFSLQFIGNPYVSGGTSLTSGTDCSGFVQSVFANFGIYLPRTTYDQSISGNEISIENLEIGDIISYGYNGYVTHSALYIGNNTIIHASTPELGIRTDNMYIMPIITIRRVIN